MGVPITIDREMLAEFDRGTRPTVADRVGAGLIEAERRLEELGGKLEHRYPLKPHNWHADEMALLHDAVDELRGVVAVIAAELGLR